VSLSAGAIGAPVLAPARDKSTMERRLRAEVQRGSPPVTCAKGRRAAAAKPAFPDRRNRASLARRRLHDWPSRRRDWRCEAVLRTRAISPRSNGRAGGGGAFNSLDWRGDERRAVLAWALDDRRARLRRRRRLGVGDHGRVRREASSVAGLPSVRRLATKGSSSAPASGPDDVLDLHFGGAADLKSSMSATRTKRP